MTQRSPLRGRALRLLTFAVSVAAVTSLSPAVPAGATAAAKHKPKPAAPITGQFFGVHHQGMHADGPIGWPQAPVGSVRMWDNYVSWREVEVAPGVFDWTLID